MGFPCIFAAHVCGKVMFSYCLSVSLCLCVSVSICPLGPLNALTQKLHFWYGEVYILTICWSGLSIIVIGSRSRSLL